MSFSIIENRKTMEASIDQVYEYCRRDVEFTHWWLKKSKEIERTRKLNQTAQQAFNELNKQTKNKNENNHLLKSL